MQGYQTMFANLIETSQKSHGKGGAINLRLMGMWPYCKSVPLRFLCFWRNVRDEMSVTTSNARLKIPKCQFPKTQWSGQRYSRDKASLFAKLCKFPNFRCSKIGSMIMKTRSKKYHALHAVDIQISSTPKKVKLRDEKSSLCGGLEWPVGSRTFVGIFCARTKHQTANVFFF